MSTRYRTRGSLVPATATMTYRRNGPTTPTYPSGTWVDPTVSSYTGGTAGIAEAMTDQVSKFRKSKSRSKWKNNPMDQSLEEHTPGQTNTVISMIPNQYGQYMSCECRGAMSLVYGGLPTPAEYNFADLVNETSLAGLAAISCLSKIEPPQSLSLVTAKEFGKTVDLVSSRVQTIFNIWKACNTGKWSEVRKLLPRTRRAKRLPKRIVLWDGSIDQPFTRKGGRLVQRFTTVRSDKIDPQLLTKAFRLWMEARYGWRVLIYEIVDTLKAWYAEELRNSLQKHDFRRVTGRAAADKNDLTSVNRSSYGYTWATDVEKFHSCDVRSYAYYEVSQTYEGSNLQRMNDFGLFDIPRSIWDAIPASFLWDWIAPIGDWLGALTPRFGVNVFHAGTVIRSERTFTRTFKSLVSQPAPVVGNYQGSPIAIGSKDQVRKKTVKRTTSVSLPAFPPVKINLNAQKLVDAVAIARGYRPRLGTS